MRCLRASVVVALCLLALAGRAGAALDSSDRWEIRRGSFRRAGPCAPGDLLIADRNNGRILVVTPRNRIVWQVAGLPGSDDAFFTPGGRTLITNQEFDKPDGIDLGPPEVSFRARAGTAG